MKECEARGFVPFLRGMAETFGKPSNVALFDENGQLITSLHPISESGTMIKAKTLTESSE